MSDWRETNLRDRADYDAICRAERGEAPAPRCSGCAHWVTHTGFVPRDGQIGPVRFEPASMDHGDPAVGQCYRAYDPAAQMEAFCTSEGIGAQLFTVFSFGCVEFVASAAGWDHHRTFRRVHRADGGVDCVADDMAHAEGRC